MTLQEHIDKAIEEERKRAEAAEERARIAEGLTKAAEERARIAEGLTKAVEERALLLEEELRKMRELYSADRTAR